MTRQELNSIIETSQSITINAELMAAAMDNAHQLRSDAIRQAFNLLRRALSEFSHTTWYRTQRAHSECDSRSAAATA